MPLTQPFAFITVGRGYSCDAVSNIPVTPLVYNNAAPLWLMVGDGVNTHSCYINGTYNGTSSGWWLTFENNDDELWLELSDSMFDRLGVRESGSTDRTDAVLEYWVR